MSTSETIYAEIGKITRLHGYKGEVTVLITIAAAAELKKPKKVVLDRDGETTPYDVLEFSMKTGTMAKMKLKGVDTEDAAKKLVGSLVKISSKNLPDAEVLRAEIRAAIGYEVVDSELGNIGIMNGFLDYPTNPILQIEWNKKEVLIPLHENFINGIDHENKQILVSTPEGLVEL